MSTQLKHRRGNTATAAAFTGGAAEFFVNSDTNRVYIHDGSTVGGIALAANTDLQATNAKMEGAYAKANTGGTFTGSVTINQELGVTGNISVNKDVSISGNLYVYGNTVSIGVEELAVSDPIIYVANGNPSSINDLGLVGSMLNSGYQHTGIVRDATDGSWKFFSNVVAEPTNTVDFTYAKYDNLRIGTLTGNVSGEFVVVNGRDQSSVDSTQNTNITYVNQFAAAGYAHANNAYNYANNETSRINAVDATQNTNITAVNNYAASAYGYANTQIGINDGINATQNTRLNSIEGVDAVQNTNITAVNNYAASAYGYANASVLYISSVDATQNTRLNSIETINTNQNTSITAVNGYAAGAFALANTSVQTVSGTSGRITDSGTTAKTLDLATTTVTAGSYGNATALSLPAFTVDSYGRLTNANTTAFTVVSSAVAGTGISVSAATGAVTFTNSGVTSAVAGTGVSVSAGTGAVTFSIGQAVATTSSVQFGSFGVGTAASGTTGEIRATNNITAYYSDRRLKDVKYNIPNALEKVLTLSGVIFTQNKKAEEFGYNNYEEQVGVIAQEVQAVLPQVVKPAPFDLDENNQSKSGENYITVQYEKLVPLLIEAIKEQQKQIDELKAKIGN